MSFETQELGDLFYQIQSEFLADPHIKVDPVKGDPPNTYEVTYDLPCTTEDSEGNISISSPHTIIISIPFGFPHFPPSCKPKSAVFHPDFDDAAVCLGDFWNRDRTLAELIRHIGEMLSGSIYSTDNAFNEEALIWYKENQNQLPFQQPETDIGSSSIPIPNAPDIEEQPDDNFLSLEDISEEEEIGIIDDEDFIEDFDLPSGFDEPPAIAPTLAENNIGTGELKQFARQKQYSHLETELNNFPTSADSTDLANLRAETERVLNNARKLHGKAEELAAKGDATSSLQHYKQVQELVVDFPNIDNDILMATRSAEMMQDLVVPQGGTASIPEQKEEPEETKERKKSLKKKEKGEEKDEARKVSVKVSKRSFGPLTYILAGGLICIGGGLGFFFYSLNSNMDKARQLYKECTTQFEAKRFQKAEKACSSSQKKAEQVFFIHQAEVADLKQKINTLVNSEEMRQGLLGYVLFNGKYVAKNSLADRILLQQTLTMADGAFEASDWQQAALKYNEALEVFNRFKDTKEIEILNLQRKLQYAEFRSHLAVAEKYIKEENWQKSATALSALQDQLDTLSPDQKKEYSKYILQLQAKSQFIPLKAQADKLFSQSDWSGAASLFQKAVEAGGALPNDDQAELIKLRANIERAKLYSTINLGNDAFTKHKWNQAIAEYEKARTLLKEQSDLLQIVEIENSRNKLDKIILQSTIIRDRQLAKMKMDEGESSEAIDKLKGILAVIESSKFSNEGKFKTIADDTRITIKQWQQERFVQDKEEYLVSNYLNLFQKNYTAASPETLTNPKASFEKRIGKLYLFKLQCTETGRGRPLKLVMYYTYNQDNRKWKFYSEPQ